MSFYTLSIFNFVFKSSTLTGRSPPSCCVYSKREEFLYNEVVVVDAVIVDDDDDDDNDEVVVVLRNHKSENEANNIKSSTSKSLTSADVVTNVNGVHQGSTYVRVKSLNNALSFSFLAHPIDSMLHHSTILSESNNKFQNKH